MDFKQERTEWNRQIEDSMKLYCDKCQSEFGFEKFNNFLSLSMDYCCCFQLKDPNNHYHNLVNTYQGIDTSQCCKVCRKVKIKNLNYCGIQDKRLCHFHCEEEISLHFMKRSFNSLSEVHDFYYIRNAKQKNTSE